MTRFNNTKKDRFLASRSQSSIETSDIEKRCKFNFSYFDPSQAAGQALDDWAVEAGGVSLNGLFQKIKDYTHEPLMYWCNERVGKGGLTVLAYYNEFPKKSDFKHPPHVPHDVTWARFRLGSKVRLVGFVLPEDVCRAKSKVTNEGSFYPYDSNTFYVVFLDKNHRFYQSEDK